MNSRERLQRTLNREPVDRVCVDFGATHVTGISVSTLSKVRKALLGEEDYRVKVIEPYQMLGEIDEQLTEALGIDVVGVLGPKTMFGFENKDWKPFTMFDGTEVLVPGNLNVTPDDKGGWYLYPEGDMSAAPSGPSGSSVSANNTAGPVSTVTISPPYRSKKAGNINSKQNLFTATPPYLPKVTPNHYSTKEPTQIQSKSELRFRNLLTFINCCCMMPADDLEN